MEESAVPWLSRQLTRVLGADVGDDVSRYIMGMENKAEVEEYMRDLLDLDQPKHKKLLNDFLRRWRPPTRKIDSSVPENAQVYKKTDEDPVYISGKSKKGKKKGGGNPEQNTVPPNSEEPAAETTSQHNGAPQGSAFDMSSISKSLTNNTATPTEPPTQSTSTSHKKTKFVPLFSEEGQSKSVAKLPGRHRCDCLATKHALINNCMQCGRIVCEQEGSGPCIFCGQLVCNKEELEILNRGSKKSDKLRHNLMSGNAVPKHKIPARDQQGPEPSSGRALPHSAASMDAGFERAVKHKNKLLEYDRTSVKRTQVIDDESDYFASDSRWLSDKERAALQQREEQLRANKHASRRDRRVTLDFAGRQVRETSEDVNIYDVNDSVVQAVHYGKGSLDGQSQAANFTAADFTELVNPEVKAPQFVSSTDSSAWGKKPSSHTENGSDSSKKPRVRIQDGALQEMSDEGRCMSMHQPWASLLVKGIKVHEGRTWYTPHRGRLWIAATAKPPTPEEIHAIEEQHRAFHRNSRIEFPKEYPTGCLLGCVNVTDCLEQDEYRQKYPDGESASPYVFICDNPQELLVKFPLKGKHKIYNLDTRIHQGAKKGLRPS